VVGIGKLIGSPSMIGDGALPAAPPPFRLMTLAGYPFANAISKGKPNKQSNEESDWISNIRGYPILGLGKLFAARDAPERLLARFAAISNLWRNLYSALFDQRD
jgi:hypothetical protein